MRGGTAFGGGADQRDAMTGLASGSGKTSVTAAGARSIEAGIPSA